MNHPGSHCDEDQDAFDNSGAGALATIRDIPTGSFFALLESLLADGWEKIFEYDEFDAWIDYGRVELRKNTIGLALEWDNWCEGSVTGPGITLDALKISNSLERADERLP